MKVVPQSLLCLWLVFWVGPSWANDSAKYSEYIKALEDVNNDNLKKLIIGELTEYVYKFQDSDDIDKMHFKIATIYHDDGDEVKSFFENIQILYLYPESEFVQVSKDRLRSILMQDKKFKSISSSTDKLLNPVILDSTREARHFAFLQDMHDLRFKPIRSLLLQAYNLFLSHFASYEKADAVLFWRAELLDADNETYDALADYLKLTYLHRSSLYVSASQLKLAHIFTEKLKDHERAITTLNNFLLEFPEDPQAAQAQMQIAKIYQKQRKQYLEAIDEYKKVAEKYPNSLEAVPALFEAAHLYRDKFDEYDKAIKVYTRIVQDFPKDLKAPYAFVEAARIYEKKLKDFGNAASVYFKVYGNYPESVIAAQSLFAAAELNEQKVGDVDRAKTYYRFVVDKYPKNKLAEKAAKRLEKLSRNNQ